MVGIIAFVLFSTFIVLPLLWMWRGVNLINSSAIQARDAALDKIVAYACERLGSRFQSRAVRVLWLRRERAPFIKHALLHEVGLLFLAEHAHGACEGGRFHLRSD